MKMKSNAHPSAVNYHASLDVMQIEYFKQKVWDRHFMKETCPHSIRVGIRSCGPLRYLA